MRSWSTGLCGLLLVAILATPTWAQRRPQKVYISADMEGVVGVVTGAQLGPSGFEYATARKYMTQEVLAAIRGARAAGATEILISDSHGNGQNLLLDELPPDVTVVRSWPRPMRPSSSAITPAPRILMESAPTPCPVLGWRTSA